MKCSVYFLILYVGLLSDKHFSSQKWSHVEFQGWKRSVPLCFHFQGLNLEVVLLHTAPRQQNCCLVLLVFPSISNLFFHIQVYFFSHSALRCCFCDITSDQVHCRLWHSWQKLLKYFHFGSGDSSCLLQIKQTQTILIPNTHSFWKYRW